MRRTIAASLLLATSFYRRDCTADASSSADGAVQCRRNITSSISGSGAGTCIPLATSKLVAHSLIEPLYGCGIRENWMPLSNRPGGSLSIYVPAAKHWESSGSTPAALALFSPVDGTARRW